MLLFPHPQYECLGHHYPYPLVNYLFEQGSYTEKFVPSVVCNKVSLKAEHWLKLYPLFEESAQP